MTLQPALFIRCLRFLFAEFLEARIDSVVAFQHLNHVKKAVISARRQRGGATLNAFSRPFG